jgi:chaperonin GroES
MIKPIGNRIYIKTFDAETKTKGGIYIPDTAQEKPTKGEIVAIGEKVDDDDLKIGVVVLYNKYAGNGLKHRGQEYKIVNKEDIYAICE